MADVNDIVQGIKTIFGAGVQLSGGSRVQKPLPADKELVSDGELKTLVENNCSQYLQPSENDVNRAAAGCLQNGLTQNGTINAALFKAKATQLPVAPALPTDGAIQKADLNGLALLLANEVKTYSTANPGKKSDVEKAAEKIIQAMNTKCKGGDQCKSGGSSNSTINEAKVTIGQIFGATDATTTRLASLLDSIAEGTDIGPANVRPHVPPPVNQGNPLGLGTGPVFPTAQCGVQGFSVPLRPEGKTALIRQCGDPANNYANYTGHKTKCEPCVPAPVPVQTDPLGVTVNVGDRLGGKWNVSLGLGVSIPFSGVVPDAGVGTGTSYAQYRLFGATGDVADGGPYGAMPRFTLGVDRNFRLSADIVLAVGVETFIQGYKISGLVSDKDDVKQGGEVGGDVAINGIDLMFGGYLKLIFTNWVFLKVAGGGGKVWLFSDDKDKQIYEAHGNQNSVRNYLDAFSGSNGRSAAAFVHVGVGLRVPISAEDASWSFEVAYERWWSMITGETDPTLPNLNLTISPNRIQINTAFHW